jgi:hypothetical protein
MADPGNPFYANGFLRISMHTSSAGAMGFSIKVRFNGRKNTTDETYMAEFFIQCLNIFCLNRFWHR